MVDCKGTIDPPVRTFGRVCLCLHDHTSKVERVSSRSSRISQLLYQRASGSWWTSESTFTWLIIVSLHSGLCLRHFYAIRLCPDRWRTLCSVFFVFHRRLKRSTRMYGSYMSWSKLGVERTARWKLRLPKRNDTETRFGCVGGSRCECTMTMVSGRTSGSRARASFRPRRVWVHARSLTSMFLSRNNITVPQSLSPQVSPHAKGEALELEVGTGQ
jgi:hypothetical protein